MKKLLHIGNKAMKIYLYDPETGIYQGEDFTDDSFLAGTTKTVPAGATTIAPPPFGNGAVPVFDQTRNSWFIQWVPVKKEEAEAPGLGG